MDLYQQRMEAWAAAYEGQEGNELVALVVATGEWLEKLILDSDVVNKVMLTLMVELESAKSPPASTDWRDAWSEFSDPELQTSQLFVELNCYAFGGLRPSARFEALKKKEGEGDLDLIARIVGLGRSLVDAIPPGWSAHPDLDNTIVAAEGRLALDCGRDLTPRQLAALAKLSPKSVKNMLAPGGALKLNAEGRIDSVEAKRWLEARGDLEPSIWQLQAATEQYVPREEPQLEDVLFVPATKESAIFDPASCRGAAGYTIGKKGAEQKLDDYLVALDRLSRMPTPFWRRPNAIGKWSTVAGVSWVRKTRAELGLTGGSDKGEA